MKGFLLKLSHGPNRHTKDAGGRTWCTDILITSLIWADDGIYQRASTSDCSPVFLNCDLSQVWIRPPDVAYHSLAKLLHRSLITEREIIGGLFDSFCGQVD